MSYFWLIITIMIVATLAFLLLPFLTAKKTKKDYVLILAILLFFPICVIMLYAHLGNYTQLSQWYATNSNSRAQEIKIALQKFGSREKIIAVLQQKLEHSAETKQTARGWYLLGKLYLANQDMQKGLAALNKAFQLDPQNPEIILTLVSTKFVVNKEFNNASKQLLVSVLNSKYRAEALNLLATVAYQQKKYDEAINYWEKLLELLPSEGQDSKAVLMVIANAQQLRAKTEIPHKTLLVTINVRDELKNKISSADTLFVYALNTTGPKLPLAVKKLAIGNFPVEVKLTDADAMLADNNLSKSSVVKVEARISKSGNAFAQSGDLVGTYIVNLMQNNHVKIIISDVVP